MQTMVPSAAAGDTTMVPNAVARQQLLGDDDEHEARQLALRHDAETRLAALGNGGIQKPKDTLLFLNGLAHTFIVFI